MLWVYARPRLEESAKLKASVDYAVWRIPNLLKDYKLSSEKSCNCIGQGDLWGVLNVMVVSAGNSPSPRLF